KTPLPLYVYESRFNITISALIMGLPSTEYGH
ncbi:unnamed protein product, partial [marine sediment metagenome]